VVNKLTNKKPASPDGPSNLFTALFVQATACAFRFLRQPSRPNAPMPAVV